MQPPDQWSAKALHNFAILLDSQGRPAEGEALYQKALSIAEKTLGFEHPETALMMLHYAGLLRTIDRRSQAVKLEAQAKRILARHQYGNGADLIVDYRELRKSAQ